MHIDIDSVFFETGEDHIENFKTIIRIMKKNCIEKINVREWDEDGQGHWISGPEKDMFIFMNYNQE